MVSDDSGVTLWDALTGKLQKSLDVGFGDAQQGLAYSTDGNLLYAISSDHSVKRMDLVSGQFLQRFSLSGDSCCTIFSPDMKFMIVDRPNHGAGSKQIWDVENGELIKDLGRCDSDVHLSAFSTDSKYFAIGPCGPDAQLWNTSTQQLIHSFLSRSSPDFYPEWRSAAFSPDGAKIAFGNDIGEVLIWDVTSFLVTVGMVVFAAYAYLPPRTATYLTLGLGDYRGIYNSAWVAHSVAILASALLSLPAFYMVKNTVQHDQRTGVGQIIATTPLRKFIYTLGKTLSNLAVLAVMTGIIAIAAIGIQLIRREDLQIHLWTLVCPFIFTVLPTMAVIASLAILFETIDLLSGGLGNVVYFLVWLGNIMLVAWWGSQQTGQPINDPLGITFPLASMIATAQTIFPVYKGEFAIGATVIQGQLRTFEWLGPQWTGEIVLARLL